MTITNQREPSFRDQISEKPQLGTFAAKLDYALSSATVKSPYRKLQQRDCEVAESQVEVIIESMQLVLNRVFESRC